MNSYRAGRPGRAGEAGLAVCLAAMFVFFATLASAATKAIRAGKVIDPAGRPIANAVIVVTDDRITAVGSAPPPAGAEVIDLTAYTVMPGMIDAHTHMTYYWDGTGRPR